MHFKSENFKTVRDLVFPDSYMCTIDLKDAYFLIPMHKKYKKYLRFSFQENLYEFNVLPFGLSTAPFVFCKLFKSILSYLRSRGLLIVSYLDDLLVLGDSKNSCLKNTRITIGLLSRLGFLMNFEKSCLSPCQRISFLGFIWDSKNITISLPVEKANRAAQFISDIKSCVKLKIRVFAKLIGYLVSIFPAFTYG